ncbi:hydrogenase iron-sulfur subunit [Thermodesulfobacteriota bacterium]
MLEKTALPPALVIGDSHSALLVSKALTALGVDVTLVRKGSDSVCSFSSLPECDPAGYFRTVSGILKQSGVRQMRGLPSLSRRGHGFQADFSDGTSQFFGCVFLTPGVALKPVPKGLPKDVELVSAITGPADGKDVGFLMDYEAPTQTCVGMTAIRQAVDNVQSGGRSFVLFRNAPVANESGEALYVEAKRSGVRFYRYGDKLPEIDVADDDDREGKRFRIKVSDVIDSGTDQLLYCDRLLIAADADSSSIFMLDTDILDGDRDARNFLLSESVHCHSGRSFRNGIFAVGEGTGDLDFIGSISMAAAAATEARAWLLRAASRAQKETVVVSDSCVRCLTCHRICPHNAISMMGGSAKSTIEASGSFCRECGICVTQCPRTALDLASFPDSGIASFLKDIEAENPGETVVVYGCERSAGRAALNVKLPAEVRLLTVPCAGRVSEAVIWATLSIGVRGVLVVGCHHGNCASETGTDWAASHVASTLSNMGLPEEGFPGVGYITCAPNESARFKRLVEEFSATYTHSRK